SWPAHAGRRLPGRRRPRRRTHLDPARRALPVHEAGGAGAAARGRRLTWGGRLRADRARRSHLRRRVLEEPAAARCLRAPPLGGHDAAEQHRGGPRGDRRVPAHLDGVPRPVDDRTAEWGEGAVSFFPYAVAAWLFVVGLWGVVSSRNLVRTVLSLTVVQSSTYLLL